MTRKTRPYGRVSLQPFWGMARLGEVTLPNLKAFKPEIHVKPSNLRFGVSDRGNNEQTVTTPPWSKAAKEKGEEIYWAHQEGATAQKLPLRPIYT